MPREGVPRLLEGDHLQVPRPFRPKMRVRGCPMFLVPQRSIKQQKNMVVGVHRMMVRICRPRDLKSQNPPPSLWTRLVPFNKAHPPPLRVARPQHPPTLFLWILMIRNSTPAASSVNTSPSQQVNPSSVLLRLEMY